MKFEQINHRFTNAVTEWIAKGYTFNTTTMAGHQGEIAHVDLTDGKEVIRILLDKFFSHSNFSRVDGMHYSFDGLKLIVGRVTDEVTPNGTDNWETVWNNRLEIISCEEFYEIGSKKPRGYVWYGTKDEAIAQQAKNNMRYKARNIPVWKKFPESAKAIVLPFIRQQPRCKSARVSDISKVEKKVTWRVEGNTIREYVKYIVEAKGQEYRLK